MTGVDEWRSMPVAHWSEGEVDASAFSDVRLGRRFADLLHRFSDRIGATIPLACQDWANTKAAYRFFANPNVEERQILSGHFEATKTRYAACEGPVLVLQDTTEFTYQRRDPHAVGFTKSVNSGRDKKGRLRHHAICGILMHSSLAVTVEGAAARPRSGQVLEPREVQGHGPAQAQNQSDTRANRGQGKHSLAR
ncbi:MAG: transposase DNA-binding-containing protein [Devosia sp.]